MTDFERIFIEIFSYKRISYDDFKKFVQIHIERLVANNTGGKYDAMIADTTAFYNAYFGEMGEEQISEAQKQSVTMQTDMLIKNFKTYANQLEGVVRGLFTNKGFQYQDFFPYGLTEVTNITKANAEVILTRLVNACNAYAISLPPSVITIMENFKTDYTNLRTMQLEKIGHVVREKSERSAARKSLQKNVYKNLLTLAIEYMDQPEIGMDFFDISFIYKQESPYRVEPGEFKVAAQLENQIDLWVRFKNTSHNKIVLKFYTANSPTAPLPENAIIVHYDNEVKMKLSDLGPITNQYIIVYNPSNDLSGTYSLSLLGILDGE